MLLHEDEIEIDVPLVRALVNRALPDLAGYPLRPLDVSGSSNALFRLGDDLLVRLPRQPGGSETIAKEARWLPYIAPALAVAVPKIVAVGEPDLGYRERWSVVCWIDGDTPDGTVGPGAAAGELARDLAGVVGALGGLAVPADAVTDPALRGYRGEPLAAMDATTRQYLADCRTLPDLDLDLGAYLRLWEAAIALTGAGGAVASRWFHRDLLARTCSYARAGWLRCSTSEACRWATPRLISSSGGTCSILPGEKCFGPFWA